LPTWRLAAAICSTWKVAATGKSAITMSQVSAAEATNDETKAAKNVLRRA
jgi:hypothetical protein